MDTDSGRVPDGTGLSQVEPQEGLAPPGFDPSRDETALLVSDKDKPLSWRELDDATLGRFARYFIITAGHVEQERADNDDWPMLALRSMHGGIALCRMTQEVNAQTYTLTLDGIQDGGGPMGDWEITIKRLRAPCDSDGSPEGGDGEAGSVRSTTARAEGIARKVPS